MQRDQTAKALGVHPRTLRRWEIGETRPSPAQWSRAAAFFARYAPQAALELATAAGVPSPFPDPPAVDVHGIEAAITRAADHLDVAPRRVRAALRDLFAALADAHGTPDDLLRAAQDGEAFTESG